METAFERLIGALENHGSSVRNAGPDKAMAQCPTHDDKKPSLSIRGTFEQTLIHCFAGCETNAILAAIGLEMCDLYDNRKDVRYQYSDGRIVYRRLDKQFLQKGNTKPGRGRAHLYRLEKVQAAVSSGNVVYVAEGEKDVHILESEGAIATCSPMGADNWNSIDSSPLHNAAVVIVVGDNDEAGERYVAAVVADLEEHVGQIIVKRAAVGKDVTDHIMAGKTLADLVRVDMAKIDKVGNSEARREMKARLATELENSGPPTWLAIGWLPRKAVTVLVGDEGIGKSLFWVLAVAHITTGRALPAIGLPPREPGNVLTILTEDSWSEVEARLSLAGADMSRIFLVSGEQDGSDSPIFPDNIEAVEAAVAEFSPVIIIVDAWLDTVSPRIRVRDPKALGRHCIRGVKLQIGLTASSY